MLTVKCKGYEGLLIYLDIDDEFTDCEGVYYGNYTIRIRLDNETIVELTNIYAKDLEIVGIS